jgi:hypothetical protein
LVTDFGFYECSSHYQKDWSTFGFPLVDYIGQTITIDIFMSGGIASTSPLYLFDLDCDNMEIEILNYCDNNGSAQLKAPRGFELYQWSNGDTTQVIDLENAQAGEIYSVDLINQLGCSYTLSFTIPNQSSLPLPRFGEDQVFSKCGDTTYIFHPQGENLGKVLLLETGVSQDSFTISTFNQQIYTFIAFSESGCPTDTLIYEHHRRPSFRGTFNDITCIGSNDGEIIFDTNYGSQEFSYTWSNGNEGPINDSLSPDTYYVTVTDQWGCTNTRRYRTTEASRPLEIVRYGINPYLCSNEPNSGFLQFFVEGSGTLAVSVDSFANWFIVLESQALINSGYGLGTHKIYAQDHRGCMDSIEFTFDDNPIPILLDYEVWLDEPCDNPNALNVAFKDADVFTERYSVYLRGDTRGTSFQNDTVLGFSMENENFSIVIRDDNFCSDTFEIEIPTTYPEFDSIIASPETCSQSNGTFQVFSVSPDIQYSIDGINFQDEPLFEGLSADFYDVYISNGICSKKSVTRIVNEEGLDPEVELKDPDCENGNNGSIRIIAPAGASYTYVWEDGSVDSSLENIGPGDYIVTISSGNCTTEFTYSLSNGSTIEVDLNPINPITCMEGSNGSFSVQARNGASPYQYSIDNGLTLFTSGLFENLAPNTYNILIIDANDCEKDTTFTIESFDAPIITEFTIVNDSCGNGVGELIIDQVNNGLAPYSYSLDGINYNTNDRFENLMAASYTVFVQDANNCSSSLEG